MAEISCEGAEVNARIVYWGIEGSGKTTNLRGVFEKLRPDHRGDLTEVPTRFDPTTSYEILPIELGEIAGMRTRIQMIAVPGAQEQAPTRKQLLDRVDGVVLVVDSQTERIDENLASLEELRQALADYGRPLDQVPLVVQYNKRDLAGPYELEELHRKLDPGGAAVFEAVATGGTGVLQTLSTISKRVIRTLREQGVDDDAPAQPEAGLEDAAPSAAPAQPEAWAEDAAPSDAPAQPEAWVEDAAPSDAPAQPEAWVEDAAPAAAPAQPEVGLEDAMPSGPAAMDPEPEAELPSERMERAILQEDQHPEAKEIEDAAQHTEALLDTPWKELAGEIEHPVGARLGPDLTIVSVGEATRSGDRAVRVPVVVGDGEGQTATLVLTIQLDPLVDENRD
jgi:signal recognition particle receptor subunit beta